MKKILIVGCGDIGQRVGRLALKGGSSVTGVVRSDESAEHLKTVGITPLQANLDTPETLADLPCGGATVFYFAPPPGGGHIDRRAHNFCHALTQQPKPAKLVYISTSGVYGDCGKETVTEESPVNPQTARARRRVDAENAFQQWGRQNQVPVVILRVTGIYGPGRLPIARLQQRHPLLREDEAPLTNRIHADDLAQVCLAAAEKGEEGDIFNVSDGHPGTMTEYFKAVAALLNLPVPQEVPMDKAKEVMNPLMLSYLSESRKMDNRKMLSKLGVALRYPTLAEGLPACLDKTR